MISASDYFECGLKLQGQCIPWYGMRHAVFSTGGRCGIGVGFVAGRSPLAEDARPIEAAVAKHESALTELERLEAIIANFADTVRHHAERIVARERTLVHLARVMRETRSTDDLDDPMATCHRHVAAVHAQTDDAPARLGERHEAVMHQLQVLSRVAEQIT